MPFAKEHAARIENPDLFQDDSFRRKEITTGVTLIVGKKKGEDAMVTQAYRFSIDNFTASEAKKWLKDHDIKYISFEAATETKKIEKMNIRNTSAFVRSIPNDDSRTIEFVISDSTKDRHDTILNSDGWQLDNYKNNPIVGYNHNVYGGGMFDKGSPDDIIGKSEVFMEKGKLIGRVTFEPADINPTAEKIYQKIKFGSLRAASVGFAEVGTGKYGEGDQARGAVNETYYFAGQELREWSIVNIPSNPSATKRNDYKEPTIADILTQVRQMELSYNNEQLHNVSIIDLLKSMEGIKELSLDRIVIEEKKLCDLYEKKLHTISIA